MKILLFLLLVFFYSSSIYSQWKMINSPLEIPVIEKTIYHPDGYLFAFTELNELFRSSDAGENWNYITTFSSHVTTFKISPSGNLFAAGDQIIMLSSDYGLTWIERPIYLFQGAVTDIEFDSLGNIYVTQYYGYNNINGVWISTDNGINWTKSSTGLNGEELKCIEKDSSGNLYVITWLGEVFKSTDKGNNWNYITDFTNMFQDFVIDSHDNFYASGLHIYKSTDYGHSWVVINQSSHYKLFLDNFNNIYAYSGNYNGILLSTDGGTGWQTLNLSIGVNDLVTINGILYAATSRGLLKTSDLGLNWHLSFKYTDRYLSINDLLISESGKIFASTLKGLYLSPDDGESWEIIHTSSFTLLNKDIWGNIYALADSLYKSTDDGGSWIECGPEAMVQNINVSSIGSLLVSASISTYSESVYQSTNYGINWDIIWWNSVNGYIQFPALNQKTQNEIFLSQYEKYIYPHGSVEHKTLKRSEDNGLNWFTVNQGIYFQDILFAGDTLYLSAVEFGSSSNPNGAYKSYDNGHTLIDINNGLVDRNVFKIISASGKFLLCQTGDGIYSSENYGSNWHPLSLSGLNSTSINNIYYSYDDRLNGCTNNGIGLYIGILPVTDVVIHTNAIPLSFFLSQNYPNPFNPSTSIEYGVGSSEYVTLKVYDVLGRDVVTLVNEEKQPSVYEVEFDASQLTSGVYYYQLKVREFVETKKMMVIK